MRRGAIVKTLRCCAELNCRGCPLEKLREGRGCTTKLAKEVLEQMRADDAERRKQYLELDVAPADRARADMATDAFYALWDAIRKVSDDLDRLAGDCRVVDAIYAVNDVRRRVGTLKTED